MVKRAQSVLILAGLLAVVTAGKRACGQNVSPDALIVVDAEVTAVQAGAPATTATVKITQVHCGPASLVGRTFPALSSTTGQDSTGAAIFPPLQVGEHGIWSLKQGNGKLWPVQYPRFGFSWPAREAFSPRYREAQQLADAMGAVCQARPADRSTLLRQQVLSQTPEVASWAVAQLADGADSATVAFLESLVDTATLPLAAQVQLDEALVTLKGEAWSASERRRRWLAQWVAGPLNESDALVVFNRLDDAALHGELDDSTLLQMLGSATANPGIPVAARAQAVRVAGTVAKAPGGGPAAFAFLTATIRTATDEEIRLAAAHTLRNAVPLDAAQIKVVQSLKDSVQDPQVTAALAEALAQARSAEAHRAEAHSTEAPGAGKETPQR